MYRNGRFLAVYLDKHLHLRVKVRPYPWLPTGV
jgi:hypothetical protein